MTIFRGKLLLIDYDRTQGLNLPIDIFFESLGKDQQEKAIGIILSGTGSDGTRGLRTIKEMGGMVMVQNEFWPSLMVCPIALLPPAWLTM